jgi:hypothetical protein
MVFIFSTPELIRNLWQLKTAIFLHWCLICAVPLAFNLSNGVNNTREQSDQTIRENCLIFQRIAQKIAKSKKTKISTTKLNLKTQNNYVKPLLKPQNTYNKPCYETAFLG